MVPDIGHVGLLLFILPVLLAIPPLLAAMTVALVAQSWGKSGAWGFVGFLLSAGAGAIIGWLFIIINNMGAYFEGVALMGMFLLWAALTWATGSAGVLIPLWRPARKRTQNRRSVNERR